MNQDNKILKLHDKNDVVRFEFNNFEYVILFASGKTFWNATGNSAMFMRSTTGCQ
jgi:hypothetical protein